MRKYPSRLINFKMNLNLNLNKSSSSHERRNSVGGSPDDQNQLSIPGDRVDIKKQRTSKSTGQALKFNTSRQNDGNESVRSFSAYSKAGSNLTGTAAEKHRAMREKNKANIALSNFRKSFT